MNYTLHSGAELDVDESCRRYSKNASGLVVVCFLDEFDWVARLLADHPGLGTPAGGERSSSPLQRFLYSNFKASGTGIRVLLVLHQHRDPEHGEARG